MSPGSPGPYSSSSLHGRKKRGQPKEPTARTTWKPEKQRSSGLRHGEMTLPAGTGVRQGTATSKSHPSSTAWLSTRTTTMTTENTETRRERRLVTTWWTWFSATDGQSEKWWVSLQDGGRDGEGTRKTRQPHDEQSPHRARSRWHGHGGGSLGDAVETQAAHPQAPPRRQPFLHKRLERRLSNFLLTVRW